MNTINANSNVNQDIKGKFVAREVFCNVNTLVEYCLKQGYEDPESPINLDELENYYSYPEWSKTVVGEELYFEGGNDEAKETFLQNFDRLIEESETLLESDEISESTHERNLELIEEAKQEFEEATEESEPQEVFEWWAISEYLYSKLKEKGHVVCDCGSTYIWGRTTTGQAILLDGVITEICSDMKILEGQKNDWSK